MQLYNNYFSPYLFPFALSLLFGVLLTALVRAGARALSVVAVPKADRWHSTPTALLGGIAIVVATWTASFFFQVLSPPILFVLMSSTLLFVVGLIDDLYPIRPYVKLIFQLLSAIILISADLILPWTDYQAVNILLTVFWFVGITNAVNLLDNMDGLAAGISAIAASFLGITLIVNGQIVEGEFVCIFIGAILGFLVFNFNPASIFMGDCGSMFLGSMLAGLALVSEYNRTRSIIAVFLTPVLILLIPIFDTCLVTFARKLAGRPVSQGGRDHTSHRLVALGMSERRAVLMLYLFAACSGVLALSIQLIDSEYGYLLIPIFAISVVLIGFYIGTLKIYGEKETKPHGVLGLVIDFSHKRRVFEVLLDVGLIIFAYYGAYILRWDADIPNSQGEIFIASLPVVVAVELVMFLVGGLYRGIWRYTGIEDLIIIARSVLLASGFSTAIVMVWYDFTGPSRGVFILNGILLLLAISGSRLSFRVIRAMLLNFRSINTDGKPVLIYGAGDGGALLIRELHHDLFGQYSPVGFIDDDKSKIGKLLHGYRVFSVRDAATVIQGYGVKEIFISSKKIPEDKLNWVKDLGLALKRLVIRIE